MRAVETIHWEMDFPAEPDLIIGQMDPLGSNQNAPQSLSAGEAARPGLERDEALWFCLRTQPRHEAFAHGFLQRQASVQSFLPRIRFRGTGRRRGRWIVEALFPGYLFCQFNWRKHARLVTYSPGVAGVIHFGNDYPVIPTDVIQQLQSTFGQDEPKTVDHSLQIGDRVLIEAGPMRGAEGVVCRVLPGKMRVALLLEFLGQQTQIEIDVEQVQTPRDRRTSISQ
jgi:transcriptional antiterminator RfaH